MIICAILVVTDLIFFLRLVQYLTRESSGFHEVSKPDTQIYVSRFTFYLTTPEPLLNLKIDKAIEGVIL